MNAAFALGDVSADSLQIYTSRQTKSYILDARIMNVDDNTKFAFGSFFIISFVNDQQQGIDMVIPMSLDTSVAYRNNPSPFCACQGCFCSQYNRPELSPENQDSFCRADCLRQKTNGDNLEDAKKKRSSCRNRKIFVGAVSLGAACLGIVCSETGVGVGVAVAGVAGLVGTADALADCQIAYTDRVNEIAADYADWLDDTCVRYCTGIVP